MTNLTVALRPVSNGDSQQLLLYGAGTAFACVNEVTANTSNYLYADGGTDGANLFNCQTVSLTGTVLTVTVYVVLRNYAYSNSTFYALVKTHGYTDSKYVAAPGENSPWTSYSYTWSTNPYTHAPWTWSEINALQIGTSISWNGANNNWAEVTQVYANVIYSPPPPAVPSVPSGPTSGNVLTSYTFSTSAIDPAGEQVRYHINWGDGTENATNWTNSGTTLSLLHYWSTVGTFNLIAMAENTYSQSAWSASHSMTINEPPQTPSAPTGTISGLANTSYNYSTSSTDPHGQLIKYTFDWGDGTQTTSGWCVSGAIATVAHIFLTTGNFSVKVKCKNELDAESAYSNVLVVIIASKPGTASTPTGTELGRPSTSYTYSTSATDPDSNQLQYTFSWGDGTSDTVIGWYASGATASTTHSFASVGSYLVKVYAKNAYVSGEWSATLTVNIPAPRTHAFLVGI